MEHEISFLTSGPVYFLDGWITCNFTSFLQYFRHQDDRGGGGGGGGGGDNERLCSMKLGLQKKNPPPTGIEAGTAFLFPLFLYFWIITAKVPKYLG